MVMKEKVKVMMRIAAAEKLVFEEKSFEEAAAAAAAADGEEQKGVLVAVAVVGSVGDLDKEEESEEIGGDKGMCQWVEDKKKKV